MSEAAGGVGFVTVLAPGSPLGELIFGFDEEPSEISGTVVAAIRELLITDPEIAEELFGLTREQIAINLDHLEEQAALQRGGGGAGDAGLRAGIAALTRELGELVEFVTPQSIPFEGLLETFSQLLLKPTRVPGEPCLAPAPLLRDLLDVALGRITGGIGAMAVTVGQTVEDFLLPAAATGDDLAHFVQAILDDPITAALNLVLGQRNQIDCVVEGGLGVAESVFQTGVRHLEEKIAAGIG